MTSLELVMKFRFEHLFARYSEFINNKSVLELGPFNGWFSENFLKMNCKSLDLVELHPEALSELKRKFSSQISTGKVVLYEGDVHYQLQELKRSKYDTVICSGLLYHSPHPFWILEGIANLFPERVFIETFDCKTITVGDEVLNLPGMRQSERVALPIHLDIPKSLVVKLMRDLNYEVEVELHSADEPDFLSNLDKDALSYFRLWQQEYGIWFKRTKST